MRPEDTHAALHFAPDGFDVSTPKLMGRQVAGNGFLRAAVNSGREEITGYGPRQHAAAFAAMVRAMSPTVTPKWAHANDLAAFAAAGVCHRPDPVLSEAARMRLRAGPTRYSLTGVTHTTATKTTLAELARHLHDPLMPWDAVICTSQAVADTLTRLHEAEADYIRWRFGPQSRIAGPQLPVIPLGVHPEDFQSTLDQRAAARAALSLADDEVAALFVGRLAFAAKAHPTAMFQGLQAAAERTGRRVVLILCGWYPNRAIQEAVLGGAAALCPDVRIVSVDGRDPAARGQAWRAGDLFVSLSDNVQETFGLTPLEAMAAGLPVVVTDWNGYRATVRDGVDGFRVPTWSPATGALEQVALAYEADRVSYDEYIWATVITTSVDMAALTDALAALIANPDVRRTMGAAGRARAAEFSWDAIYRQYQALWAELAARRRTAAQSSDEAAWLQAAPRAASNTLDPFDLFGGYPTRAIAPSVELLIADGARAEDLGGLIGHPLFVKAPVDQKLAGAIWSLLAQEGPQTVRDLAVRLQMPLPAAIRAAATLAKTGLFRLR